MKKYLVTLLALLLILSSNLFALKRDYKSDCDEDNSYQDYYHHYCLKHAPGYPMWWLSCSLAEFIPVVEPECRICSEKSIYLGYLDPDYRKYRSHLRKQLKYYSQHVTCNCYWPEYSLEAAQISDSAYLLFRDLILTTALSRLLDNEEEQKAFIDNPGWFLNKHGLTIAFIAQQFRFSDYYHVCKDIENYAKAKYDEREVAKIKDKLEDLLEALYPKFFALYTACINNHPSLDIEQEIRFMKLLVGDISGLDKVMNFISANYYDKQNYNITDFIVNNLRTAEIPVEMESKGLKKTKNHKQDVSNEFECLVNTSVSTNSPFKSVFAQSEFLLEKGSILNDLLVYKSAINVLTEAIKLNPLNREAYVERAAAYFETNQLSLALEDYEQAKKLTIVPPFKPGSQHTLIMTAIYIPENKAAFSKGLLFGTLEGAKVSTTEFIPSIFNCCSGILNGLWAFALSPLEISQEMVNAAYAVGEYIASHSAFECLECVVPELQELSFAWYKIDDYSRGQKIGYIIGKYGVDVFMPAGVLKCANKVRALKRANIMCTLEGCAASQAKKAKILKESAKRAAIRETLIVEAQKSGKILVRNANTRIHIMQPKHQGFLIKNT